METTVRRRVRRDSVSDRIIAKMVLAPLAISTRLAKRAVGLSTGVIRTESSYEKYLKKNGRSRWRSTPYGES